MCEYFKMSTEIASQINCVSLPIWRSKWNTLTTCLTNRLTALNFEIAVQQRKFQITKNNNWKYPCAGMRNSHPIFAISLLVFKHLPNPHTFKWAHSKILFCKNFICISVSHIREDKSHTSLCFFSAPRIAPVSVHFTTFCPIIFLLSTVWLEVALRYQSVLLEIHEVVNRRKRSTAYCIWRFRLAKQHLSYSRNFKH